VTASTVSLFCGGGGESVGKHLALEELGIPSREIPSHAINHWDLAVATHGRNLPWISVHQEDITQVTAKTYGLKHIDLLWASPSCVHHSRARGGKPREEQQRSHAWEVVDRWLRVAKVDVLLVENVSEFMDWGPLDEHGQPIKARKGEDFRAFVADLRKLGYQVEWRVLCAADYGDPTTRRRFFLQAARDGHPVVWPEPTHHDPRKVSGEGLLPWRTAAECIDWSLPCRSIFDRKKPLAEATLRRIATGVVRFVLNGKPFIVNTAYAGTTGRGQYVYDPKDPMRTITSGGGFGAVVPTVEPFVVNFRGGEDSHIASAAGGLDEPLRTVSAGGNHAGIVTPFIAGLAHGEHAGRHEPRVAPATEPLRTIHAGGNNHALVAAFLAKHYGGGPNGESPPGLSPNSPLGSVTAVDHHAVAKVDLDQAGGPRAKLIAAFLTHYYGTRGQHQSPDIPLHTVTTIAKHGLVTVDIDGASYVITDIGLRMLEPRELALAMGFPSWYRWEKADGSPLTKRDAVKMIGNACPVGTVKALIKAVVLERREAFGMVAA
jgi:DNA (cytosine-5)-methyltransferase 1